MRSVDDGHNILIGGAWQGAGHALEVHNPADGSIVGRIAHGGRGEARRAADAAEAALGGWTATPPRQRADVLLRAADLLQRDAERLGMLLSLESGKLRAEATGEIRFAAEYCKWFAERARDPRGHEFATETTSRRARTLRRPIGVVACLTPWNFPVSIQARKLAPALAAGCTVVARASEKAPLAVVEMIALLVEAGVPDGVVNLVHGPAGEVTDELLAHRAVRAVSFTGSTEVGRKVMRQAAERIVRPLLELGGDAPFIVFGDADLDAAVEGAMVAKFRNNGQSCIAANRFLVHDAVHDEFVRRLAERINTMKVGDPRGDVQLGPLIDRGRVEAVQGVVEEALGAGARRATEEVAVPEGGSYCPPTLLVDVPDDVALSCDEVFGPVAAVFRFDAPDEALQRANDTEMGLAAYAYTRDAARVEWLSERLEAGVIGINTPVPSTVYAPMGGVKQSGLGREGGHVGMEEFQETHYVAMEV